MFTLGRGLSLSSWRREWLVKDIVAGTGADWAPVGTAQDAADSAGT